MSSENTTSQAMPATIGEHDLFLEFLNTDLRWFDHFGVETGRMKASAFFTNNGIDNPALEEAMGVMASELESDVDASPSATLELFVSDLEHALDLVRETRNAFEKLKEDRTFYAQNFSDALGANPYTAAVADPEEARRKFNERAMHNAKGGLGQAIAGAHVQFGFPARVEVAE